MRGEEAPGSRQQEKRLRHRPTTYFDVLRLDCGERARPARLAGNGGKDSVTMKEVNEDLSDRRHP